MLNFVREGDRLDSNGCVVRGSPTRFMLRRGIARKGDPVSCPRHGDNRIAEGHPKLMIDGLPAALHGHRCECDCRLISSMNSGGVR